jgi:integrase
LKSGDSGLLRKPLSKTTIQEKGLLGNRVSLRKTGLFSEKDDRDLLGHSDVRTTMIYTHCVPSRTLKELKSPLDL